MTEIPQMTQTELLGRLRSEPHEDIRRFNHLVAWSRYLAGDVVATPQKVGQPNLG